MKIVKYLVVPLLCFFAVNCYMRFFVIRTQYRQTSRHISTINYIKNLKQVQFMDYFIIGDSTCLHNYIPKDLTPNTYSACISGGTLMDAYEALKGVDINRISKGIIVSNTFNTNTHYNDDFWKRTVITGTYSFSKLSEMYDVSKEIKIFPATKYSKGEFLIKVLRTRLFLNEYSYEIFSQNLKTMKIYDDWRIYFDKELEESQGFIPMSKGKWKVVLKDEDFFETYRKYFAKPFVPDPTDLFYFSKIEEIAKAHKLKLIVLEPVLGDTATNKSAKAFKESFRSFFKNHIKEEKNFYYYEQPELHFTREDLFDYTHLNYDAVQKTTQSFKNYLEKLN